MEKCKRKLNQKETKLDQLKRRSKYFDGELEGVERMRTERELLLENQKDVDNQGLIIDSIQKNVKDAGTNLENINKELNSQGQNMDNIQENILDAEDEVKKTGKIMAKIERRHNCMKVVALMAIIFLAIADVAWIVFLIIYKNKNN